MLTTTECRDRAMECRQMAEQAQTLHMRDALVTISRTWTRLALEVKFGSMRPFRDQLPPKKKSPARKGGLSLPVPPLPGRGFAFNSRDASS